MITMLLMLLAILLIATGIGVARDNNTTDENLTWGGTSRTRVKRALRSQGFWLVAAGQLAVIMGDESWAPQPSCGKSFVAVPREGRATKGVAGEKPVVSGTAKKAVRSITTTRAAVLAKRQRDLAATAAKVARRAERTTQRAHGKGVWAAQVRAELAARRKTLAAKPWPQRRSTAPTTVTWLDAVRAARRPEAFVALARGTSSSALHMQADALEAVLAAERLIASNARLIAPATARQFGLEFQTARARIAAQWAVTELREELLAA